MTIICRSLCLELDENGIIDISATGIETLTGCPQTVEGYFDCGDNRQLVSLRGGPTTVKNSFRCAFTNITNLEGAPQYVGAVFNCIGTELSTLHNVHKYIKYVGNLFHFQQKPGVCVCTHILGLSLINGLQRINSGDKVVDDIFFKYKHDILLFQDALIDAGYIEQAKL